MKNIFLKQGISKHGKKGFLKIIKKGILKEELWKKHSAKKVKHVIFCSIFNRKYDPPPPFCNVFSCLFNYIVFRRFRNCESLSERQPSVAKMRRRKRHCAPPPPCVRHVQDCRPRGVGRQLWDGPDSGPERRWCGARAFHHGRYFCE